MPNTRRTHDAGKRCRMCRTERPGTDFHKNRAKHDGLQDVCRFCRKVNGRGRDYPRFGENNPRWTGGLWRENNGGYLMVTLRDGSRQPLHRAVMEHHLGRPLLPGEVVHHINEDLDDNRIENLLLTDASEHALIHWQRRRNAVNQTS